MSKFKVGDKVRYIGDNDDLKGIYTIYEYYDVIDGYFVTKPGDIGKYGVYAKDLILAETSGAALTAAQDSTVTIPSPYTWTYYSGGSAVDNPVSPVSGSGIVFTKEIPGNFTLQCECGAHKVYGENAASDLHSSWCPLYRKS